MNLQDLQDSQDGCIERRNTPVALLLKPAEAAKALAISPRKLWALTASGQIPHVHIGKCVRYPLDDLQRWIAEHLDGHCRS